MLSCCARGGPATSAGTRTPPSKMEPFLPRRGALPDTSPAPDTGSGLSARLQLSLSRLKTPLLAIRGVSGARGCVILEIRQLQTLVTENNVTLNPTYPSYTVYRGSSISMSLAVSVLCKVICMHNTLSLPRLRRCPRRTLRACCRGVRSPAASPGSAPRSRPAPSPCRAALPPWSTRPKHRGSHFSYQINNLIWF